MPRVLLALALLPLLASAAPVPKSLRKAVELDVMWRCEEYMVGNWARETPGQTRYWMISGQEVGVMVVTDGGSVTGNTHPEVRYQIRPSGSGVSGEVEFGTTGGPSREWFPARFQLNGDSLHLVCPIDSSEARPKTCDGGPGVERWSFRRVDLEKLGATSK